jgi:hypothetical protein
VNVTVIGAGPPWVGFASNEATGGDISDEQPQVNKKNITIKRENNIGIHFVYIFFQTSYQADFDFS